MISGSSRTYMGGIDAHNAHQLKIVHKQGLSQLFELKSAIKMLAVRGGLASWSQPLNARIFEALQRVCELDECMSA
jgi:hypothetical protein